MRIFTRSENQNEEPRNYELLKFLEFTYGKLHKSLRHEDFLQKCLWHRVIPKFIRLPEGLNKHISKEETF